jgi:Asp-tRNA(Asn)/Glu-tRNA(Gln) amidotransferase A subunit family amidase
MQEIDAIFRRVDVLLAPAMTGPMTVVGNMTGHPCLTIRAGFAEHRTRQMPAFLHGKIEEAEGPAHTVPHAITIMPPLFDEGAALTLGRAMERTLAVADRRPPMG